MMKLSILFFLKSTTLFLFLNINVVNKLKEEKINIPQMKEDLIELNNQIDTYLKLESENRVGNAYKTLIQQIIERRDLLKRQLTDMGELLVI